MSEVSGVRRWPTLPARLADFFEILVPSQIAFCIVLGFSLQPMPVFSQAPAVESARPESARINSTRSDASRSDASRSDANRSGANRSGATRTVAAQPDMTQQNVLGASIYLTRCAGCHDRQSEHTPSRVALSERQHDEIVASLTNGQMRAHASGMSNLDIQEVARYLVGSGSKAAASTTRQSREGCSQAIPALDLSEDGWRGWGNDNHNSRYQARPGLTAKDVPRLKVKWVYAYDASMTVGQPAVFGDRIYVTSNSGEVLALDARTGCTYWSIKTGVAVRTALIIGEWEGGGKTRFAAYFGDDRGNLHAVDADTGEALWKLSLDKHVAARITGTPLLHENRLYVPVSSGEEGWAQRVSYQCCSFRGSLVALDAATGRIEWQTFMIADPAAPYRVSAAGTQQFGPAGAAIWSSPTLDAKRGLLYVGTGNSYTDVPTAGSNAIVAIEANSGKMRWSKQILPNDNYVMPCLRPDLKAGQGNCPKELGPDHDFGASPILSRRADGKDLLLAGQKSGTLYALDPDEQGLKLWETSLGSGSALGGIQWGMAADEAIVYVPVADPYRASAISFPKPGLSAVRVSDGAKLWQVPVPVIVCSWGADRCRAANSAAVSAMPGVVFAGAADGHLRAHAAADGALLWDFDTAAKSFEAVNGKTATGGSIDTGGPVIAHGMVFVNSGYGRQLAKGGNALFAFSVDGK